MLNIPKWIDQDLSPNDIAAINQGGCESGAYMPAVTYYTASQTMAEHGDDVLDYLNEVEGDLPTPRNDENWSGMACFYLSRAVEDWCLSNESIADWEDEDPINS